jgi:carbon storage regulator (csrA)
MLVLSRNTNERICIGDDIVITVVEVRGDRVRVGIEAPKSVAVHRQEIFDMIVKEQENPTKSSSNATKNPCLALR